jgi:FxLD family lantipeptide
MSASTTPAHNAGPPAGDGFDLDITIIERSPAARVLFEDTDDGCNTIKGSDC